VNSSGLYSKTKQSALTCMLYVLIIRFHARIHGCFWNQKLQKRRLYVFNCVCYSIQLLYLEKNKDEALFLSLGPPAEEYEAMNLFGFLWCLWSVIDRCCSCMH